MVIISRLVISFGTMHVLGHFFRQLQPRTKQNAKLSTLDTKIIKIKLKIHNEKSTKKYLYFYKKRQNLFMFGIYC